MYRPYYTSGYHLGLRFFLALALCGGLSFAATGTTRRRTAPRPKTITPVGAPVARGGPWTEPTYADSSAGDFVDGEDLEVRRAAVEALEPYTGSVIAVDAESARIRPMVNQRAALVGGFQPCSTIKVSVALPGLSEKVIQP